MNKDEALRNGGNDDDGVRYNVPSLSFATWGRIRGVLVWGSMVFSSLTFLYLFLPITLLATLFASKTRTQNAILLVASLFFYAWGEPVWVLLMVLTGTFAWLMGFIIERSRDSKQRKHALIAACVVMLGSLMILKYADFFIRQLNVLPLVNLPPLGLTMPIGISFYTFQVLTYVIDLYRGEVKLQTHLGRFLLYQSLFPQLIAGPIVRYADVDRQITERTLTMTKMTSGIARFLIGLAKKLLIADGLGQLVALTMGHADPGKLTGLAAWSGLLAWGFQIYFDFSGYSDMAIGLGQIFGFDFKENFDYPYIARSITDFWRRWHMSLGTFFRDYVYIPLGGNRRYHLRNMFIVWALTGFWHGAAWNFLLWGLYFFVFLALEKYALKRIFDRLPRILGWLYAMAVVFFGWAIFYYTDLGQFRGFVGSLFGATAWSDPQAVSLTRAYIFLFVVAAIAALPIVPRARLWIHRMNKPIMAKVRPQWLETLQEPKVADGIAIARNTVLLLLCTANLVASSFNPFLYFRF